MGSQINRNLQAKARKAVSQSIEAGQAEYSKPCYRRAEITLPLYDLASIEWFNGREVRKIATGQTMRQALRSHF
jgi:hypothetical protein